MRRRKFFGLRCRLEKVAKNSQGRIVIRPGIKPFIILVLLVVLLMFSSPAPAQKGNPPFPRDGAKKVLENNYFVIWDVTFDNGKASGLRRLPLDQVYKLFQNPP